MADKKIVKTANGFREVAAGTEAAEAAEPENSAADFEALFDDARGGWVTKISRDRWTYYFKFWSDDARNAQRDFPAHVAGKMGLTLEEYADAQRTNLNAVTPAQSETHEAERNELVDLLCADALAGVAPLGAQASEMIELTPERARHLRPDLKRFLSDYIVSYCRFGIGESEYLRLTDTAAL